MRKFTKFLMVMAMLFVLSPQEPFAQYTDNFDSYTVGGFIAVQNPTWWTTWSNLPGSGEDGEISTAFSSSPTKSVVIDEVGGLTDLVLKLGNKTSGAWEVNFDFYVETGKAGYYNIQHYETPGIEWAYEVYFKNDGSGKLFAGSSTPIVFTYPKNTWFQVINRIDIANDLAKLYVNGVLVHTWPFHYTSTGTSGVNQLGGVDFFAGNEAGDSPRAYFDDIEFIPVAPPPPGYIEIGSGTTTGTWPAYYGPWGNYWENCKTQTLYLASELGAPTSKLFTSLAWNFGVIPTSTNYLNNVTIKIKETTATSLTSGAYADMTGATQVFYSANLVPATTTGWKTFDITDYVWTGSNNLIVEVVWGDNGYYVSPYFQTYKTTGSVTRMIIGYADGVTPPNYSGWRAKWVPERADRHLQPLLLRGSARGPRPP